MKLIQIILIPALLLLILFYFRRLRSLLLDRIIILVLGLLGVLMVIFPERADKLAQAFGVGRGADLVVYLTLVGLAFFLIVLISKIRTLETRLTEVARFEAIAHADRLTASGQQKSEQT